MSQEFMKLTNLKTHFPIKAGVFSKTVGYVRAVDGITMDIMRGETLGLVGESGCGKTTVGRSLLRLVEPSGGQVEYEGRDILTLDQVKMREIRRQLQIIFQDPYSSLNPRMTVERLIGEVLQVQLGLSNAEARERTAELLIQVGLSPIYAPRYPHEFSGGQRQRVAIAKAIALQPQFIVCDEAVSALDVSIQSQIINLLDKIQEELGLSYLFIAHDLSMVKHISDRIGVMYLGHMVECGPSNDVYHRPLHPYTVALLSAIPIPDPKISKAKNRIVLDGEIPSPINPPKGCVFSTRCPKATDRCRVEKPEMVQVGSRQVSCFLYEK